MLRNIVELFLILQVAHDLEAISLHYFDIQTQRPDITGNAHLIQPSAELDSGDGMCFIRLFTQQLIKLQQLNLLHIGSHAVPPL